MGRAEFDRSGHHGDGGHSGGDWGHHEDHGHDGGHDHWNEWDHHHSSFALSFGIGIGWYGYWGAPVYNGCFSYYDPWWYHPYYSFGYCGLPVAYYDPWWHGNHWSFCVAAYDPCAPHWYWQPSYVAYSWPGGTYLSFRYCRPSCDWSADFRFSDTPCAALSTNVLVPSCNAAVASTSGAYQYGWLPSDTVGSVSATTAAPSTAESLPPPATVQELLSSTDRELADTYMRLGDVPSAIRVYQRQLAAHPGDVRAERSLGLALISDGRVSDGAERLELAYRIDPGLAHDRIPGDLFTGVDQLEQLTDAATQLATQQPSPAAWLTVSVLYQARGQTEQARNALEQARASGLAQQVVESMQASLPVQPN